MFKFILVLKASRCLLHSTVETASLMVRLLLKVQALRISIAMIKFKWDAKDQQYPHDSNQNGQLFFRGNIFCDFVCTFYGNRSTLTVDQRYFGDNINPIEWEGAYIEIRKDYVMPTKSISCCRIPESEFKERFENLSVEAKTYL